MTIHAVEVTTPGVVVYGGYTAEEPLEWWDDESACAVYPAEGGTLRFDERTTLPTRPLIGCLAVAPAEGELHAKLQGRYGGNLDCREIRAGATLVLPVGARRRRALLRRLQGAHGRRRDRRPARGRRARHRERRAAATARVDDLAADRDGREHHDARLGHGRSSGARARPTASCSNGSSRTTRSTRPQAALLLAMVAHAGICQISNTDYTAYCVAPRDALEPYRA